MKKTVFFIAITLFTLNGFAQGFGVNLGYNMANMKLYYDGKPYSEEDDMFKYQKSLGSLGIGVNYDYELSENLYVAGGLNYVQRGFKISHSEGNNSVEIKTKINYLDIPVMLKYNFEIGDEMYLYGKFGPSIGLTLGGSLVTKVTYEGSTGTDKDILEFGNDKDKDNFKSGDFGLNFGVGVLYNNIEVGINYYSGMKNIGLGEKQDYKHRVVSLMVGYRLDLGE